MAKHSGKSVLKWVDVWQQMLIRDFVQQFDVARSHAPADLPERQLEIKRWVFELLMVILCLYLCEQRQIIQPHALARIKDVADAYAALNLLWQQVCDQTGQRLAILQLPARPVADQMVQKMIVSLYAASQHESISILAVAYEQLLTRFDVQLSIQAKPYSANASTIRPRKLGGIYYTPKPIVEYIVQSTIHRAFANTSSPYILDPACGGGAFLLAAYEYLLEQQLCSYLSTDNYAHLQRNQVGQWQLTLAECSRLLQLIHGVDIDSQAIKVTQLSLWLKLLEQHSNLAVAVALPELNTIQVGNALTALNANLAESEPSARKTAAQKTVAEKTAVAKSGLLNLGTFQWQSAFPTVLAAGGFDVVIGNPPYVDAESMAAYLPAWRLYCTTHYQVAKGNWDLFCVFIEKALQLCCPGGFMSMIVPNKLLSADYASVTRDVLTCVSHILCLRDYSNVYLFDASVYPIVYLAQKVIPEPNALTVYEQMQTVDQVKRSYSISLRSQEAGQAWSIGVTVESGWLEQLEAHPQLGDLTQVTGAATVAEAYAIQPLIQNKHLFQPDDLRLVNSGTIDRYRLLWGDKPLRYLRQLYDYPVVASSQLDQLFPKRLLQAKQPKIIVAGMSQRLECALDWTGEFLAAKSTSIVRWCSATPTELDLRYLLAILNSRLISAYFLTRFSGNRLQGNYLRIGPPQLRQLPIVVPKLEQDQQRSLYQQVIERVELQHQLNTAVLRNSLDSHLEEDLNVKQNIEQVHLKEQIDTEIDMLIFQIYQLSEQQIAALNSDFQL